EYNPEVFKDKTILLPCDDPEWSNFTKYFASNFTRLGIKKLISTSYAKGAANKQPTLFELESPLYNPQQHDTHGKLFTLTRDTDGNGTVDTDDIEFTGYLEGDGDFRSSEVKKLRDEADIIITNPPFSLFREFLAWVLEADKQFVIIGNINAITYKEVFPLLSDNKVWLGYSIHSGDRKFNVPDDYPLNAAGCGIDENGKKFIRVKGVRWFTNIDHGKRHENLILDTMEHNLKFNKKLKNKLEKEYGKLEYPHYDNYDAIEVPFIECIPSDYDGVMGVPITFMDKYNPDQFDIVAFRKGEDGKDLVFTREREYNRTFEFLYNIDSRNDKERRRKDKWESYLCKNNNHPQIEPVDLFYPLSITSRAKGTLNGTINGKETYRRILIKLKSRGN
ncbi:MAG: adenine-specific methyltransferase EcoRI family protein, partial [Lactobacillus gasseri]|nr:adenine-specific methyltransferase EcoRI family protein [Lactobacillus gasseri]